MNSTLAQHIVSSRLRESSQTADIAVGGAVAAGGAVAGAVAGGKDNGSATDITVEDMAAGAVFGQISLISTELV